MVRLRLRTAFAVGCLAITTILVFRTQDALAWQSVRITSPANNATVSGTVVVNASVGPRVWWAKLYIDGGDSPVSRWCRSIGRKAIASGVDERAVDYRRLRGLHLWTSQILPADQTA